MNRRDFTKKMACFSSLTALTLASNTSLANSLLTMKTSKTIKPNRLKKGDLIGLVAPASPFSDEKLETAIQQVESLGFKTFTSKRIRNQYGYLAGKDKDRLADLHEMFERPEVKGIWCVRGGYGSARLLPDLNYKLIKRYPKAIIGYSDITALLNGIFQETGLIGFHGPVAVSNFNDYVKEQFSSMLMDGKKSHAIPIPDKTAIEIINHGEAKGRLVGGNLSLLSAMVGTGYLPKIKNKILFIEEVGEKPYRIDRMLTQLLQALPLEKAAAILLGTFSGCEARANDYSLTLSETLKDRLGHLDIPVVYGLPIGHIDKQCFLPIGAKAYFNSDDLQFRTLESPVV